MQIRKISLSALLMCAVCMLLGLTSCMTPKKIAYFQDVDDVVMDVNNSTGVLRIQPEDKLQISVSASDPDLAAIFNLTVSNIRQGQVTNSSRKESGSATVSNNSSLESQSYYTVDNAGNIDFPILGTIHVAGMSRMELAGYIKGELAARGLLKDAIVIVEFVNSAVSVLGEVNNPGRYVINRDHISVLDALAVAGDLTIQGKRENVLVVREENGKRYTYRLDLTQGSQLMSSPAYYLQANDVVYVEPSDYKKRQTTVNGNNVLQASFWVSVASLLTSVAVLIFK